jgi:hypothetical protein
MLWIVCYGGICPSHNWPCLPASYLLRRPEQTLYMLLTTGCTQLPLLYPTPAGRTQSVLQRCRGACLGIQSSQ